VLNSLFDIFPLRVMLSTEDCAQSLENQIMAAVISDVVSIVGDNLYLDTRMVGTSSGSFDNALEPLLRHSVRVN
jgi:hypothetical protein